MTITTLTRKTALTGTGVLVALALAACGTTSDNGDDGSASPGVDASSSVANTPTTDDGSGSASSSASSAPASSTAPAAGGGSATGQADEPAYAVIDAVLEKHGDGERGLKTADLGRLQAILDDGQLVERTGANAVYAMEMDGGWYQAVVKTSAKGELILASLFPIGARKVRRLGLKK